MNLASDGNWQANVQVRGLVYGDGTVGHRPRSAAYSPYRSCIGCNTAQFLDHIVLGKCGPVYVDTKTWKSRRAKVHLRSGKLWYGNHPQKDSLDTVLWEASRVAEVLGHPVQAVVAVHYAAVPPGGLISQGVTIIQSSELRRFLRALPKEPGWDRRRIAAAYRLADTQLRPAG